MSNKDADNTIIVFIVIENQRTTIRKAAKESQLLSIETKLKSGLYFSGQIRELNVFGS